MQKPLEQWICDRCGKVIESPNEGWVEWIRDGFHKASGFKIVHHGSYSPRGPKGDCYHYTTHHGRSDTHLDNFLNNLMVRILAFLDVGQHHDRTYGGPSVKDMREFVEFSRRLTLPYYEEARLYWSEADADGFFDGQNEISIYLPDILKKLIETYGK